MSFIKVKEYFKTFGIENQMLEFDSSSATVELASKTLGVKEARIAKTLSFKVNEEPLVIVMAGDAKIDNAKYKHFFHKKAHMLSKDEVSSLIGHDVGGVCPFALPTNVKSYLDVSLKRFSTIYPAVGSSNSAIKLTCNELEKYASNFSGWIDVSKDYDKDLRE